MNLTLVINSLGAGGAERVLSIMANYWAEKKWKITLLTFDDGREAPFYELDNHINHIPLNIASNSFDFLAAIGNNVKRLKRLRSAMSHSKPNAVISFMDKTNVLTLLATYQLKIPILISERVDTSAYKISNSWEMLRRLSYPLADKLVLQTQAAKENFPLARQLDISIIPNPILAPPDSREILVRQLLHKPSLIAMGRLTAQKGFDLLLQAFNKIQKSFPEWKLIILGEGELRQELESLRDRLGLRDYVNFIGKVKNPYEFFLQADIFVLASRFEGFPNALCEAMACGLPVISTDCANGPREIIRNGIDGILVPNQDVSALAEAMERLMADERERIRLATRAKEITERFSLEKVMLMWETLLLECVGGD
ncbi:glycosyltransferase family 4 protein [Oscillatoria sp. FACHB-1406]|uniref:glycosyltransferase family 4 protein n=1 Tax=Oscillatoria sp. FACHB-1406 TaxID=2692846 RepID=UPI00168A2374|nr:glycosyltransferase family 4 protein [Oscillatoria sp. FACHB-1406]MBD2577200.1 glycosyltransferase family 4 protein [Oscillatoria sp. FACHB-1406]